MQKQINNYEREINLTELLIYCLKKWRWIAVGMLIMAILIGAAKVVMTVSGNQNKTEFQNVEDVVSEELFDKQILLDKVVYYEKVVEKLENEIVDRVEYLENSVVMEMDPYCLQTGVLTFHIELPEKENQVDSMSVLIAAYQAYVTDGRLAQSLTEVDESVPLTDLQQMLSVSAGIQEDVAFGRSAPQWEKQSILQVSVVAPNKERLDSYMEAVQSALLSYKEELVKQLADHKFTLLASSRKESKDDEMKEYQSEILESYPNAVKSLEEMRALLEDARNQVGAAVKIQENVPEPENPVLQGVKFAVVGAVIGAAMAFMALVIRFFLSKKLLSVGRIEQEFGIAFVGLIREKATGKGVFEKIDQWILQMEEGACAKPTKEELLQIGVSNVKNGIAAIPGANKIMLAGSISEKEANEVCEKLKSEMTHIQFSEYVPLLFSANALNTVQEYDAVLFVEQLGVTERDLIWKQIEAVKCRGVKVLGTIVVE